MSTTYQLLGDLDSWGLLLALSVIAGLVSSMNHTPSESLTMRQILWNVISSLLVAVVSRLFLDDFKWSDNREISVSVGAAYLANPLLYGGWRIAMMWSNDPTKFIIKK